MLTGKVESVTLLSRINTGLDYCEIRIDFDTVKIFGDYEKIIQFVGKIVLYETTMDVYHGEQINRIVNFYESGVIQTVDKTSGVKLYSETNKVRAVVNFSVDSIRRGDSEQNCIALLSGYEKGTSEYSTWLDCKMVDKYGKAFVVRLFNKFDNIEHTEKVIDSFIGCYVQFHVQFTRYGLQTEGITFVNTPVVMPPEVEIAEAVIRSMTAYDTVLQSYMEKHNLIQELKTQICYEPGYRLVEIAAELYEIENLCSVSDLYDKQLLIRTAIASRGYLLPCQTRYSKILLNINKVLASELKVDKSLIMMLDIFAEEEAQNVNKVAYYRLKEYCNEVMKEKRGVVDEKENVTFMSNAFSAL